MIKTKKNKEISILSWKIVIPNDKYNDYMKKIKLKKYTKIKKNMWLDW